MKGSFHCSTLLHKQLELIKQSCTARKFLVTCIDQSELIFSKAVQLLKHTAELIFNKAAELIQHDCIILLHCVDFNKCTALLRN